MPASSAPDDDNTQLRHTYNFAPGNHGLIYRAETSERGADPQAEKDESAEPSPKRTKHSHIASTQPEVDGLATKEVKYKLQAAKWGLIPFWTKRAPDYSSQLKTINCRDDSLAQNGGMWNTMKQRKRCVVVAEGFYEWLKKDGGKTKIPHYTKRADGQLFCFAGLWDCVHYEGEESGAEGLWTYTIITTESNSQLRFLHDRMPVILEPGSKEMRLWLDPHKVGWDRDLQKMLKPYEGELECYPVDQGVGKVGNNSPLFVVPVNSKENKKNIANFFGRQAEEVEGKKGEEKEVKAVKKQEEAVETSAVEESEGNAPLPKPVNQSEEDFEKAIKAEGDEVDDSDLVAAADELVDKDIKREVELVDDKALLDASENAMKDSKSRPSISPAKRKAPGSSPVKGATPVCQRLRSATTNSPRTKTPNKEGNARITAFFGK
ncbi:hypothetical protein LTR62_008415 [Meristemomyces frigidus]|uniref:DUF159 domain protein n=1 Tax=Meristemomyces frigidus TaxID=1508187 RepID=A0AAN7TKU1_9PEZI|nr:hypothetical protein LTR62_008415 [Meristemomyces frigidus]